MPLPTNFGNWEHLLPIVRNLHNYRVRDFFRHQRYDKHDREPTIDRPINNLLQACKIGSEDSAIIALLKIVLFEISIGNAARLQPGIYGIPAKVWDEYTLETHPQVFLFFEQDLAPEADEYSRIQAEVKFRLMDETSESMTQAKARSLATKIKAAFGQIPTWDFEKGKNIFTYQHKKEGYWLQVYTKEESDAEQLIKKVLEIQGHTYDSKKFKRSTPKRDSDNITGSRIVMGKTVKVARYRPTARVRFRYATLTVPGIDPIVLYDPYYRLNTPDLAN